MDQNISRWSMIVWMDRDQLDALHHREVWLGTRSGPLNRPVFQQKRLATWEGTSLIIQAMKTRFQEGYWPKSMDSAAQYNSLDAFAKAIYPLWKGIEEKDKAVEDAMTTAEASKIRLMLEVQTLHKQDTAIYMSGIKPARMDEDRDAMDRLRRKAIRASGQDAAANNY